MDYDTKRKAHAAGAVNRLLVGAGWEYWPATCTLCSYAIRINGTTYTMSGCNDADEFDFASVYVTRATDDDMDWGRFDMFLDGITVADAVAAVAALKGEG
jgi:hypothetical protein